MRVHVRELERACWSSVGWPSCNPFAFGRRAERLGLVYVDCATGIGFVGLAHEPATVSEPTQACEQGRQGRRSRCCQGHPGEGAADRGQTGHHRPRPVPRQPDRRQTPRRAQGQGGWLITPPELGGSSTLVLGRSSKLAPIAQALPAKPSRTGLARESGPWRWAWNLSGSMPYSVPRASPALDGIAGREVQERSRTLKKSD